MTAPGRFSPTPKATPAAAARATPATRAPRLAPEALAYQAPLDRLVASPAPLVLRLWPALAAGLLLALFVLAALMPVDIVVSAQGRIATATPPVLLRPAARAVLTELLVRPGDLVVAGQPLARLDALALSSDLAALEAEHAATAARIARAEADLAGQPMASGTPARAAESLAQSRALALHRARDASLLAELDAIATARQIELEAHPGLAARAAIAAEIEAMRADLVAREAGSHLAQLTARADRLAAEAALESARARLAELDRRTASAEAARVTLAREREGAAAETLATARPRLATLEEALAKTRAARDRATITAPAAAVVLSVAPGGPGTPIAEGEPVVVLVPTDADLVVEAELRSADLGRLSPGDPVDLRIDAFPWRRHGIARGVLAEIGPASFTPEGGTEARHPARIRLTAPPPDLPPGARLIPGMTLTADIVTGRRSVLGYLTDPLHRGLTEALREP